MTSTDHEGRALQELYGSTLEPWRLALRELILPGIPRERLFHLHRALRSDDEFVVQGSAVRASSVTYRITGLCPVCYLLWRGDYAASWEAVDAAYSRLDKACAIRGPDGKTIDGLNVFTGWVDGNPRRDVWRDLAAELETQLDATEPAPVEA